MRENTDIGLAAALGGLGRDDEGAWSRVVALAGPALARTCARIAGPDLGQDALQDCLLLVRARASAVRAGDDAAAMAWLQRVATTAALRALRRRRRAARLADACAAQPPRAVEEAHAA